MDDINSLIDDTPCLSGIRKEYLQKAVSIRYDEIIVPAYKKSLGLEKTLARSADRQMPSPLLTPISSCDLEEM
jgi:hypothetical protein